MKDTGAIIKWFDFEKTGFGFNISKSCLSLRVHAMNLKEK